MRLFEWKDADNYELIDLDKVSQIRRAGQSFYVRIDGAMTTVPIPREKQNEFIQLCKGLKYEEPAPSDDNSSSSSTVFSYSSDSDSDSGR